MHSILVPVDGSAHALKALHIACDLAEKYGGQIVLLHVLTTERKARRILERPLADMLPADLVARLKDAADAVPEDLRWRVGEGILDDAAARTHRRGLEMEIMPIVSGDPVECILVAARRAGANTIVMGCRGLSDEETNGFGSVSRRVFETADCTCISVK